MPIMDSELQDAGQFALIPNTLQNAFVSDVTIGASKESKAPMATLEWTIAEGDYAGRKIKFDILMLGGKTKDGKPQSLGNLCNFIYYTGMPWSCGHCGTDFDEKHSFYIGTKDDADAGLKVGIYYCPNCKNKNSKIKYDTDHIKGQRCAIRVGSRKEEGGDREFNKVSGYTDWQD